MQVCHVKNGRSLTELFRFRYNIYVKELGWLTPPPVNCSGILRDNFDHVAYNYAAYNTEGNITGSVRVIPDGPLGLPLEKCNSLNEFRLGKVLVEISRLCVGSASKSPACMALLMKAGYERAISIGASHLVIDSYIDKQRHTPDIYLKFGFSPISEPYTDPTMHNSNKIVALALDLAAARSGQLEIGPRLFTFFTSPDDRIDHGGKSEMELGV